MGQREKESKAVGLILVLAVLGPSGPLRPNMESASLVDQTVVDKKSASRW